MHAFQVSPSNPRHTPLSASVLDALAQGSTTVLHNLRISMPVVGNVEDSLVTLVRRNPNLNSLILTHATDGITDAVLYALAENCARLSILDVWATPSM
jgi:hypothetical protein